MKYDSKNALIADCEKEWRRLWEMLDGMAQSKLAKPSRSKNTPGKWTAKDILAHLHAWHRLLLNWYRVGLDGQPDLPSKGFNWQQLPALNQVFYDEFKNESYETVRRKIKLSYGRVLKLARSLSEKQMMKAGQFAWTGKLSLATYFGANSAGHYRWAQKKIKKL